MQPRRWEELAWPELAAMRSLGDGEVGLIPVGATEQHGPHLPTGTDTIVATALCDAVSASTGAPALSANGVTGRPSEATPELGKRLLDLTVAAISAAVERGRTEKPPLGQAPMPALPLPPI